MVGMMVAVLLYVVFWGALRWRRNRTDLIGPLVVLAYPVFFMLLVSLTFVSRRIQIMVWGSEAQASSNDARHEQIAMGLPKVLTNPIGHGAGQAADTIGWRSGSFLSIDNYYLLIVLEYGVVGFILYYGLIIYVGIVSARTVVLDGRDLSREQEYLMPISISLAVFFVIKSVFSEQDNHPLVFMFMGMVVAILYGIGRGVDVGGVGRRVPMGAGRG
jgi:O-antigen ligase